MQTSLLSMCISSFMAVFTVLAFLAAVMRLIIVLFPEKLKSPAPVLAAASEAPIYAAISATYNRMYPDKRVSKIEEIKK